MANDHRDGEGAERTCGGGASRSMAGKAQLAWEVCAAAAAFASGCPHRRRRGTPAFVDWYLVLAIGEAAPEDAIRRRYRQLALQLHPDKNRHPKAEVAFKIVSEAHACLTDEARRRDFDAERAAGFCAACPGRTSTSRPPLTRHRASADRRTAATPAPSPASGDSDARREVLRGVQARLRDECRVIDGCLRANDAGARRRKSFPLFDPSDRRRFPDYPHTRPPPPFAGCRPAEFWPFFEDQCRNQSRCRGAGAGGHCESPVYQIRTAPERTARSRPSW